MENVALCTFIVLIFNFNLRFFGHQKYNESRIHLFYMRSKLKINEENFRKYHHFNFFNLWSGYFRYKLFQC